VQSRRQRAARLSRARADRDASPGRQNRRRHYAGPNWEYVDGSGVAAKLAARAPAPDANDIPWLKLDVTERCGNGLLSGVTTILRINTRGGGAPVSARDKAGTLASVAYSTDYVFLRKS
jgi:hypothetical protein